MCHFLGVFFSKMLQKKKKQDSDSSEGEPVSALKNGNVDVNVLKRSKELRDSAQSDDSLWLQKTLLMI